MTLQALLNTDTDRVIRVGGSLATRLLALPEWESTEDPGSPPEIQLVTAEELDTVATALQPVQVEKDNGNLVLGVVANTWHDVDAGGSASARPLDVVIPGVAAGQWVRVEANIYSPSAATAVYLDVFTVVAGSPVNQFGSATTGTVGWLLPASLAWQASNSARYQLQAGDIENGAVRLRLRDRNTSTTARSIGANSGIIFEMAGTGPF